MSLSKILKGIARRPIRGLNDPCIGLEYNKLAISYKISRKIYSVDIARNPRIVNGLGAEFYSVDVLRKAEKANSENVLVNKRYRRIKGRY